MSTPVATAAPSPAAPRPGPVLVLGGTGMLGHKVWQVLSRRHDAHLTAREPAAAFAAFGIFDERRWHAGVDATEPERLAAVIERLRPAVVVNCVGIIKQRAAAKDPIASTRVNALFPHQAHALARAAGAYFIHISTDCVFSGARGGYTEEDLPDPPDLYGRSKLLGEITAPDGLTLRTSIIGRELRGGHGLVEWFLGQANGSVRGFANAIFSGMPTLTLASVIADLIERRPRLNGLYHLAAAPISKYELLLLLRDAYGVPVEIARDEGFRCDRSLSAARLAAATGIVLPPWPALVAAMAADSAIYSNIHSNYSSGRE